MDTQHLLSIPVRISSMGPVARKDFIPLSGSGCSVFGVPSFAKQYKRLPERLIAYGQPSKLKKGKRNCLL